jgi:hypothetical protein
MMINFTQKNQSWFILRFKSGHLVGLDENSGGYPIIVTVPSQIYYWPTSDKAKDYASMFLERIDFNPIQVFGLFELEDTHY